MNIETPLPRSASSTDRGDYLSQHCQFREAATTADIDAVRSLVTRTGFFRPDEIEIAVQLVSDRLARGAPSGYEFLFAESIGPAKTAGELIGYACFGPIPCTIGSYDLYWIAVDPNFQGRGIGRRLLAGAESRIAAAGGRRIYIDTSGRSQYAPTRAFYEQSGYQIAARLSDFYAPGDDRVIYVKSVANT